MNVDIAASAGPFGVIDAGIRRWLWADSDMSTLLGGPIQDYRRRYRRWLWAHSGISTLLLPWAHSGLLTRLFGAGHPRGPRIVDNIAIAHLKNRQ